MKYYHLGKEKRDLIDKKYNQERLSITEIAKHLGVSKSTISREIKGNSDYGLYNAEIANQKVLSVIHINTFLTI